MTWEFGKFSPNHSKVQKFYFNRLFLSKIYDVWPKTYRGVIFHDAVQWCKTWISPDLVVSKMAWGIGWTLIRAPKSLKNCTLMGSFCPKHIMFQLENFKGVMCHMTLKGVAKFKEKLTCGLKNDIRNLVNFYGSSRKSEMLHFDRIFMSKA